MTIKDVSAATMYDVLHDGQYRKEWDPAMYESFDIARLSANADVGYYSCEDCFTSSVLLCVFVCHPADTCSAVLTQSHLSHIRNTNTEGESAYLDSDSDFLF